MATTYNIAFELGAKLTSEFRSAFNSANAEMSKLLSASQKMTSMGKSMTLGVTAPLMGMGAMAVKTFASFDDSMRNVQAVSGATGEEFKQLTQLAKDLGAQTAWSASQSADAMGYLALAGWDTNQIMAATPGLLDLASAATMDLASAADIVSDVMSAFGMGAEQATQAADMFAMTSKKSNTDVNQLGEALKYAGAAANAAEMDLSQTNAVLGILANQGIKGSMAGTTVVSMLRDLKKNSKDGAIAVGEASVALYDQAGNMRDLGSVMADVEKATQGMTTQQKDAALSAVFGTEAMKGANIMLAEGSEKYRELEEAIRNSEGTAAEMREMMEGGIGGAMRSLMSAIEALAISFGETLAPYVKFAAGAIANFAKIISTLPNGVRLVIVAFSLLLASIGPTLLIMGLLIRNTLTVISTFKAARTAVKSLDLVTKAYNATQLASVAVMRVARAAMYGYRFAGGGVRGVIMGISAALQVMNLTFLANPYVIAAAGITAVAFALYKAWNNSERFRNVVIQSMEMAKQAIMSLYQYIQSISSTIWTGLTNGISGIGTRISGALQSEFAQGAKGAISGFIESFREGMSSLPGIISMLAPHIATIGLSFLGVTGPIGMVIGAVISLIGFIYRLSQTNETVANAISSAWSAITSALEPVIKIFSEAAEQIATEVGPEFEKTMQVISESIAELAPQFAELGGLIAEIASLLVGMLAENVGILIEMWMGLAAEVIPMVIEVLPILMEVFSSVLSVILQVVMAVLPIIVELISMVIPIILEIVQVVLPILLEIFTTVFMVILEVVMAVLPVFVELLSAVIQVIMTLVEIALPMILEVVQMVLPVVLAIIQAIIPVIAAVLQVLVSVIVGVVVPAINMILQVVQIVFPFIQMIISNALAVITGILQAAMALIQGNWSGAWNAIKGIATTIMNNIVSFFSGIDLFSVGKSIIDGLINGIKSMAGAVVGAIANIVPAPLRGAVSKVVGAIPGFAEGGVVSAPTLAWVGEGGDTESIIPWNSSQRSKDLWVQTGQALGMLDDGGPNDSANAVIRANETPSSIDAYDVETGTTNNNNTSSANFTVVHKGNVIHMAPGSDPEEVQRKIEQSDEEFERKMKELMEEWERRRL